MNSMAHIFSAGGLCERVAPGIAGYADSRQANARSRAQGLLCRPRAGATASLCGRAAMARGGENEFFVFVFVFLFFCSIFIFSYLVYIIMLTLTV